MIALYENLRRKLIDIIQKHIEANSTLAENNVEMIMKNQEMIDKWIKKFKLHDEDLPEIDRENIKYFDIQEGEIDFQKFINRRWDYYWWGKCSAEGTPVFDAVVDKREVDQGDHEDVVGKGQDWWEVEEFDQGYW